jgi:hypothetical protein
MLCPVCHAQPLKGRQTTCSAKCRSAKYRERKQQQRGASQRAASIGSKATATRSQRDHVTVASLTQLVSSEVDRIIAAIQQVAELGGAASTAHRVDLREQVTSQAPDGAVGYRLVLPRRVPDDGLRLSPRRSRSREVAWYSLSPFECPDDLRLCDGHWYHLVWYDAQGRRMRPSTEHGIPALYYFLGPPSPMVPSTVSATAQPPAVVESASVVPTPQTQLKATGPAVEPASGSAQASLPTDSTSPTAAEPTALHAPPARQDLDVQPGVTEQAAAAFAATLRGFPNVPQHLWALMYGYVLQVPWMIWLLYEDRRRDAELNGKSPPPEPTLSVPKKDREVMASLLQGLPPYFIPLCKRLFACVREHGSDVLQHAPVPFEPLSDEQRQPLVRALRDAEQRTYLDYVCRWQDAMLSQALVPPEPDTKLRSEQRREIWKCLADMRAAMFVCRQLGAQPA